MTSTGTFAPGTWHSVMLQFATNAKGTALVTLNVDGKAEGKMTHTCYAGSLTGSGAFRVGARDIVCDTCTYRRNFLGYIDQVKMVGVP